MFIKCFKSFAIKQLIKKLGISFKKKKENKRKKVKLEVKRSKKTSSNESDLE